MASLTIPNLFIAGTPALASEMNANFAAVVAWSSGLDQDNMTTFTGDLAFTIANGNAIVIQNNGNDESIKITQGALLGANKASILITDGQTQTASGAAELKMLLAAGATIPAIHILHASVDTFKLTKDYLRLEALLKLPAKTTAQRNAISSPEEGTVIYNSSTEELNIKDNSSWGPVGCPIGSIQMYAGAVAPKGWLICNGDIIPNGSGTIQTKTADYSQLYAVIGSTFGSAGKLPDLRGMFVRGAGTNGGAIGGFIPSGTLGIAQPDSTAINGLSSAAGGGHTHMFLAQGGNGNPNPALGNLNGQVASWNVQNPTYGYWGHYNDLSGGGVTNGLTFISYVNDHSHALTGDLETKPVNVPLTYIIKY